MRKLKKIVGLLAIMLLMASCIKVEGVISINDDGSGSVDFLSAIDADAFTSVMATFGLPDEEIGTAQELCDEFAADGGGNDFPAGAQISVYEEDGFCGQRAQYDLDPSLEHSSAMTELFGEPTQLYKDGNSWFFESALNLEDVTADAAGAPDEMIDALFADASFRIVVDLPGQAVPGENNATFIDDGGVFTWDIDFFNPPSTLFAETNVTLSGGDSAAADNNASADDNAAGDASDSSTDGDATDNNSDDSSSDDSTSTTENAAASDSSSDDNGAADDDGGGLNPLLIALPLLLLAAGAGFFLWKRNQGSQGADNPSLGGTLTNPLTTQAESPAPFAASTPPLGDGFVSSPPVAEAATATVIMSASDVEQSVQDTVTHSPAAAEPVFDEALNAWVIDDPIRGRLRHDPATDTWGPI